MNTSSVRVLISAMLLAGIASQGIAQTLAQRSFNQIFQGDDPGELFTFDLPFEPSVQSVARFDGFFENLDPAQTSVLYELFWPLADGSGNRDRFGIDFTPLPASGRLPVRFEHPIAFTPDAVFFHVEGGGPSDHFRFVGEFSIQQVPEPTASTLAAAGAVIGLLAVRRRRTFRR